MEKNIIKQVVALKTVFDIKMEAILARPDDTSSFVRANELPVRQ